MMVGLYMWTAHVSCIDLCQEYCMDRYSPTAFSIISFREVVWSSTIVGIYMWIASSPFSLWLWIAKEDCRNLTHACIGFKSTMLTTLIWKEVLVNTRWISLQGNLQFISYISRKSLYHFSGLHYVEHMVMVFRRCSWVEWYAGSL